MEGAVTALGGVAVGRILQRRGASRSNRPGGTKRMELPLTQKTIFGSGKLEELVALVEATDAKVLIIYNAATESQRKSLAERTGCRVYSFPD